MKNKEKTPYEEWIGKKHSLSYLCTWGCLAKVNMTINKKRKLSPKIVDCAFLKYAHHSITYRFLVIKSKVPDVHVDTFLESCDVTFFENIFTIKNPYDMSSLPTNIIANTTPELSNFVYHTQHTPEPIHEEIDSEAPRRSKKPRTVKFLGDDFTVYLMNDTPKTIAKAFASPDASDWKEIVHSDMDSILSNGT
jgi:spore maturation protein CgeB